MLSMGLMAMFSGPERFMASGWARFMWAAAGRLTAARLMGPVMVTPGCCRWPPGELLLMFICAAIVTG